VSESDPGSNSPSLLTWALKCPAGPYIDVRTTPSDQLTARRSMECSRLKESDHHSHAAADAAPLSGLTERARACFRLPRSRCCRPGGGLRLAIKDTHWPTHPDREGRKAGDSRGDAGLQVVVIYSYRSTSGAR